MRTVTLADAYAFWNATGRPNIPLAELTAQLGGPPPAAAVSVEARIALLKLQLDDLRAERLASARDRAAERQRVVSQTPAASAAPEDDPAYAGAAAYSRRMNSRGAGARFAR